MLISFVRGQTSVILRVKILDPTVSTGAGKTGIAYNTNGLTISTIADNEASPTVYTGAGGTIETISTLGTYAAPTSGKCRFREVSSAYNPGIYEIQLADARLAISGAKSLLVSISGAFGGAECDAVIPLTDLNPYDAARAGLSALPTAAAGASGGLPTVDANNRVAGLQGTKTRLDDLHDFNPATTDVTLADTDLADLKDSIKGTPSGRSVKEAYDKAEAARAAAAALVNPDNQSIASIKSTSDKLNTTLEADGSVYRLTANALEQGLPGAGVGDWTADERKQIRQALGVAGTAAATTGSGNLDVALSRLGELRAVPLLESAAIVAAGQDITFTRGDTQPITFDLGRDITGASLKFTVKRRTTDPQSAALIAKSSAQVSQIVITQAAAGRFAVKLLTADTASLLPDGRRAAFLYDVEMTISGVVETIFAGSFVLLPDVTTA